MRSPSAAAVVAIVLASAAIVQAQNPPVTVSVDRNANRHAISPLIYGVHFAPASTLQDLNATINRYGGNSSGRYNWQQNVDNRGGDYFFLSIPYGDATAGGLGDSFIGDTKNGGAQPFLTMPMVGWVARTNGNRDIFWSFSLATCGAQTANDAGDGLPDAGNGCKAGAPANYPCGNTAHRFVPPRPAGCNTFNASVAATPAFQTGWVQHIKDTWGAASAGGLKYWGTDNEPSIWHTVYWDVHPSGATDVEVRDKMIAYGDAIKSVDATTEVLGPEEWGWEGYYNSGADQLAASQGTCQDFLNDDNPPADADECPDYHAHGAYVPYLLQQLKAHDDVPGNRKVIDWLSLHYYPQSGEFSDDVSTDMKLLRNRSTRELWDPNYVSESYTGARVQLIPRMKGWVSQYYPGLKVALTEYNWGAPTDPNGATAQADVLGILGREGADMAILWTTDPPPVDAPLYNAFKIYRNYDGSNSAFGDTSVAATVPDPDELSAFAAERTADGKMTVVLINKSLANSTPTTVNLSNFAAATPAKVYRVSGGGLGAAPDVAVAGNSLTLTLPAQTVTLLVISPAGGGGGTPTADLAVTKTDGQTSTFPGQPLIYTITVTNNGPSQVTGATIVDNVPASITNPTWTCSGAGGGTCGAANGNGSINTTANLPNGGSVTFFLQGNVASPNPGPVRNTVTVTPPGGTTDPVPSNNTATDDDFLQCTQYAVLVPDGRAGNGTLGAGATTWFVSTLRAGASYYAEFQNRVGTAGAPSVTVFRGDDGCMVTTTAQARDTSGADAAATSVARASFTASGTDPVYRFRVTNGTASSMNYTFRLGETTLFSPAWSSYGTYDTYFSLQNTTRVSITGTLTLVDATGAASTMPVTVNPGETASTNTVALAVPRNRAGTASFTHNGPPGGILATAAIANFTLPRPYIQPVKFEAVREIR